MSLGRSSTSMAFFPLSVVYGDSNHWTSIENSKRTSAQSLQLAVLLLQELTQA